MEAIASILTLKKVTLMTCGSITDNEIRKLGSLTRLQELRLIACRKITEQGMDFVRHLPKLHSLTITQCHRVSPPCTVYSGKQAAQLNLISMLVHK